MDGADADRVVTGIRMRSPEGSPRLCVCTTEVEKQWTSFREVSFGGVREANAVREGVSWCVYEWLRSKR